MSIVDRSPDQNVLDYESGYHETRHPHHSNKEYYDARAEIALKKFFSNVDINKKILDFGCGLGQNIYKLKNAVGYDISDYAIEFCRAKGLTVTNNLSDLMDNEFDYVFSAHVLEHHPNPMEMINTMRSKLAPGQDLILILPFEKHGKGQFELDINQHLFNWNFQNINNLLLTCGFKIQKNKYIRGAGYQKLLPLRRINFNLYRLATIWLSRLFGIKEMMIIARKADHKS